MGRKAKELSREEKEMIDLFLAGNSTMDVAEKLKMPHGTVAFKMSLLRERFGFPNTTSLIAHLVKEKLV